MKKFLLATLLALGLAAVQARVTVWENPSAFTPEEKRSFKITRVEMHDRETVVHLTVSSLPLNWFKVSKGMALRVENGKHYALTGGASTDDTEMDLVPDSTFWMPRDGRARIALHFRPVPASTRKMHLVERNQLNGLCIWNICDPKRSIEPEWPNDWQNIQYDTNENLPAAQMENGMATISVRMLDYQPEMKLRMEVYGFRPLGSSEAFFKYCPFADDGTLQIEVPLRMTREVFFKLSDMWKYERRIVIGPNQKTEILMKAVADSSAILAYKGYMARTNTDLMLADGKYYSDFFPRYGILDSLANCETAKERIKSIKRIYDRRILDIRAMKYTPAAKNLLRMDAESEYMSWTESFGKRYAGCLRNQGNIKFDSQLWTKLCDISETMLPSGTPNPHTIQYFDRPTAPTSHWFWNMPRVIENRCDKTKWPLIWDMLSVHRLMHKQEVTPEDIERVKDGECKAILSRFMAKKQRQSDKMQRLQRQPNVYYKTYDDVAPRDLFSIMLNTYKEKAVLLVMWNVDQYACTEANKALAPLKEQLKDKDIQFIYVTSTQSNPAKWLEMVSGLPGDHYYLTDAQFRYLMKVFGPEVTPLFVLYDKSGDRAYQSVGFPGVEPIQKAIKEVMKTP